MPLILVVALALLPSAQKPLPISAHNCYAGASDARLKQALALGIDNIEIDLGWDDQKKQLIVGHDETPVAGSTYPTFEHYVRPIIDAKPRPDGAPRILSIDWKTSNPEAVAKVKAFLDSHADVFSSAPKKAVSPITTRRLTVCFTGSEVAKDHYDKSIASGGEYRAFSDRVHGAGDYKNDPKAYAAEPASAYHRFLTFHWGVIERGGPPRSGDWTDEEETRLKELVKFAHEQGYRLRFYCLNAGGSLFGISYRFPDLASARTRWLAAAQAGVDWIASDNYAEIVKELANARLNH